MWIPGTMAERCESCLPRWGPGVEVVVIVGMELVVGVGVSVWLGVGVVVSVGLGVASAWRPIGRRFPEGSVRQVVSENIVGVQ